MGLDQSYDEGQLNPKDHHAVEKSTQGSTMHEQAMGDYFVGISEQKEGKSPQVQMRSVDHPSHKEGEHKTPKPHSEHRPPVGTPGKPPGEIRPCTLDHKSGDSNNQSAHGDNSALKAQVNKCTKRVEDLAEHMKLGASVSDTVKGKVALGAKIVKKRGRENLFKEQFHCDSDEKLLKASVCYLFTTTGPIGGLLFTSTKKLAFCSERTLAFTGPSGGVAWSYYRVSIPVAKVSSASTYENVNKPAEKSIRIKTVDNYEFWFMGFVKLDKAYKHIQEALKCH